MSNSTAISLLKDALQNAYELGNIEAIESIATDEEEYLKAKGAPLPADVEELRSAFRVTSSSGSYFLKRVSSWVSDEQLKRVERFLKWSEAKQLSISPRLIEPIAGGSSYSFENNRYQLFEFVEQEKRQNWMNSRVAEDYCRVSGELLCRLRHAFNQYENSRSKAALPWPSDVLPSVQHKWKLLTALLVERRTSLPDVFREIVEMEAQLRGRLSEALEAALKNAFSFDKHGKGFLAHGDFHPGNVLIACSETDEKTSWAIDFDHIHSSTLHFDLGYALVMFAMTKPERSVPRIDWVLARSFLQGYAQEWHRVLHSEFFNAKFPSSEMQKYLNVREITESIPAHMTIACFLIIDWAADRFLNGPQAFAGLYEGIVSDMLQILMFEDFNKSADIYFETLKEILG